LEWRGYLVAIIVFGCSLIGELVTETIYKDDKYYQTQSTPLAIALLTAGIFTSTLAGYVDKEGKARKLVDKETGEEIIVKTRDLLFFIPIRYWGPILIAISLVVLIFKGNNY
jgi:hypothetical protein